MRERKMIGLKRPILGEVAAFPSALFAAKKIAASDAEIR
jgi:hypothetical protein